MINKKAQFTAYIIIGIVMIVVLIFGFILAGQLIKTNIEIATELIPVKVFVEGCLDQVSTEALVLFGMKSSLDSKHYIDIGGYNLSEIKSIDDIVSIGEIEYQLSRHIETALPSCIDNFSSFKKMKITGGTIKADTKIAKRDVKFELDYKVELIEPDKKHTARRFSISQDVRFIKLYEIMENITKTYYSDNHAELYSYLGNLDINTTIYPFDSKTIFVLKDEKSRVDNKPFQYVVALS